MSDIFISPKSTIKDALKKLDQSAQKVLLVVDDENRLLGTITDGDIRRHILKTGKLEGAVDELYNKNPHYVYQDDPQEKAKKIMFEKKIELLPVLSKDRKVVGTILWTDLFDGSFHKIVTDIIDIPVVIMAGGKGTRLDPFTKVLPKPLLPIKDKTITEHIIDSFRKFGVKKYFMTLNYKGKMIEAYFNSIEKDYEIEFISEEDFYGTAGSLYLLKDKIKDNFFVTNCDIILRTTYPDVLKHHKKSNSVFTFVTSIQHYKIPYGVVKMKEDSIIESMEEKPEFTFQINTGVYLVNKKAIDYIPPKTLFDMPDLVKGLIKNNQKIVAYPVNEHDYIDVGEWEEYKNALDKMKL
jgi:dTDP-glucose pyrophosphorylase/predicted transcriptional regulator